MIFDSGLLLGIYDKVHMFDINIPNKINHKESDYVKSGSKITLVETRFGRFGMGICYDIRFASYAMALR